MRREEVRFAIKLARLAHNHGIGGLINMLGLGIASLIGSAHVPFKPMMLYVETTTKCNLRCIMCPRSFIPRPNRDMSFEDFKMIIDQLPHPAFLVPQGIGEPLLNPDIFQIISYSVGRGAEVSFNTNATLLTEEAARKLILSGLQVLYISIDSANEGLYRRIRPKASLAQVIENVRNLIRIKEELGSRSPHLMARVVVMKENLAEIPGIIRLTKSLGIDDLAIQDLVIPDPSLRSSLINKAEYELLLDYKREAEGSGMRIKLENFNRFTKQRGSCKSPWLSPYITVEGYVTPCCMITDPAVLNFGNVYEDSLADIWNGDRFVSFRADFSKGKVPSVCKTCPNY